MIDGPHHMKAACYLPNCCLDLLHCAVLSGSTNSPFLGRESVHRGGPFNSRISTHPHRPGGLPCADETVVSPPTEVVIRLPARIALNENPERRFREVVSGDAHSHGVALALAGAFEEADGFFAFPVWVSAMTDDHVSRFDRDNGMMHLGEGPTLSGNRRQLKPDRRPQRHPRLRIHQPRQVRLPGMTSSASQRAPVRVRTTRSRTLEERVSSSSGRRSAGV